MHSLQRCNSFLIFQKQGAMSAMYFPERPGRTSPSKARDQWRVRCDLRKLQGSRMYLHKHIQSLRDIVHSYLQVNEPTVLEHLARTWQSIVPASLHSSLSVQVVMPPEQVHPNCGVFALPQTREASPAADTCAIALWMQCVPLPTKGGLQTQLNPPGILAHVALGPHT